MSLSTVEEKGRALVRAEKARDKAMRELVAEMVATDRAGGVGRNELVDASGITKRTFYRAAREHGLEVRPWGAAAG